MNILGSYVVDDNYVNYQIIIVQNLIKIMFKKLIYWFYIII